MGEEHRAENVYQEGYRSLWEMLQGPVPDTVRARSLADLETPDGFLNFVRGQDLRPQCHVNHLNNCRDQRIGECRFRSRGFDIRGCFLLALPSSRLRVCCGFGLKLLRPGRLPGGGQFRLTRRLRDRLGRGFWDWGWNGGGLSNTPIGRRDSTTHPGPSARQMARPAGFSERQFGLWR